jgi:hypothetical protein
MNLNNRIASLSVFTALTLASLQIAARRKPQQARTANKGD